MHLSDAQCRCVLLLVHEKVLQGGTSKTPEQRAFRRIFPKYLDLCAVSLPIAKSFCGSLLQRYLAKMAYFDPLQDWPKPIEQNMTIPILLEDLVFLGDTRSRYELLVFAQANPAIPANVPQTKDVPDRGTPPGTPRAQTKDKDDARQPEEEARNILAAAYRNQAENGPNTRRAAIRACKHLKVLVDRHGTVIHKVHQAAREHTQQSKSSEATKQQHSAGGSLPKITPELTSELLHCLNAIPDPWPMAKIAIDMEKPAQWVTKMCRLYFADIYARKTKGIPTSYPAPSRRYSARSATTFTRLGGEDDRVPCRMDSHAPQPSHADCESEGLPPYLHVCERILEFYLGLKVTASLDREESYTRIIDGQVRCITQEHIQKGKQLIWNVEFLTIFVPAWMIPRPQLTP